LKSAIARYFAHAGSASTPTMEHAILRWLIISKRAKSTVSMYPALVWLSSSTFREIFLRAIGALSSTSMNTKEQENALLSVYTGKQGGPIADLVQLIGEVVAVQRSPITFQVEEGKGSLRIGSVADCEMEPFRGPNGEVTTLRDSIFSTIPGSPAYVAKATKFKMNNPALAQNIDLKDHNAIQGDFVFQS
jgi:hypothetical protein